MDMIDQLKNISENDEGLNKATDYIMGGGTFKGLKGISDEAMEAIYSVAYNMYMNEKYEDSVKMFQFLCFHDHINPKYFLGLGACLQMQKEYEKALDAFSFVLVLSNDNVSAQVYMGDCYMALGDVPMAIQSYDNSIVSAGDDAKYKENVERAKNMLQHVGV